MFTGIVEEKGKVKSIIRNQSSLRLTIQTNKITEDVHIGDSISVNGVCLTVTTFEANQFSVDVIPETYRGSSLKTLQIGSSVNLERAMQAQSRFGGHFVSGHVDAVGMIKSMATENNALYIDIEIPEDGLKYIALKGSISVDGTSLTVFGVKEKSFVISLIPETQRATILGEKEVGDMVNVEYDMLAKYMDRLLATKEDSKNKQSSITTEKLESYGFLD
ncbi:riboflavin synthase [Aquibacillus salsiterrae]|uniref:Riboflavin synthase n=1 Tax=Aquibacillus salsiterrae TaxID=2950439 RepID=A0A9X3WCN2_9BACI|nr:riboflavin synthase [Aquibacillus salsiterrae]MDC3417072.1 riboflavin synthase [Aquibacillus salsiterrae]